MTQKFHISKDGIARICTAKGACPLGGEKEHYPTIELAKEAAEEKMVEEFGIFKSDAQETIKIKKEMLERELDFLADAEGDLEHLEAQMDEPGTNKEDLELQIQGKKDEIDELELEISQRRRILNDYKRGVFFNSTSYQFETDPDFIEEDVEYYLNEYTNKPRGEVVSYALASERVSHYGAIANNGAKGYGTSNSPEMKDAVIKLFGNNNVTMGDSNGKLQVISSHHDGSDISELKPITKSRADKWNSLVEYGTHEEIMNFLDKIPSVKIKSSKRIVK